MPEKTLREERERTIRREMRSPRSAALAGIVFSLLMITSMILLHRSATGSLADIDREWLGGWSGAASVVLVLVPFAGIAFLWFTGVMRDLMGNLEDKFFSTVFLGSGIILVVMIYVWAATVGAVFGIYALAAEVAVDRDVYLFGLVFMNQIIGNHFLRMAAVYMLSIASLWTRTKVVPRWLTSVTYVFGLGVPAVRGPSERGPIPFPGLGPDGECLYSHHELPLSP